MHPISNKKFWTKAVRLLVLKEKWFCIPETLIVHKVKNLPLSIFKSKKYIVRPSYIDEDSQKTKAWFYKSTLVESIDDFKSIFDRKGVSMFWDTHIAPRSIIIQEFIQWDIWWVYFTRNPLNIYEKWFYEISTVFEWVTRWFEWEKIMLDSKIEAKLFSLWEKVQDIFWHPQDIEFVIKDGKLYFLQSRNITTWDMWLDKRNTSTIWRYMNIDNGEFPKVKVFTYSILRHIIDCTIVCPYSIYWKRVLLNKKIPDSLFAGFLTAYKKYLLLKPIYSFFRKIIFWQKLDTLFLQHHLLQSTYTLDVLSEHPLPSKYCSKKTYTPNISTLLFLKIWELKHTSFLELEKCKRYIRKKNTYWEDIHYLTISEFLENTHTKNTSIIFTRKKIQSVFENETSIFIKDSTILSSPAKQKNESIVQWWKLKWIVWNVWDIQKWKGTILKTPDLDFQIYDCIDVLKWVIAQKGKKLSHTAIVLRECNIPTIIDKKLYSTAIRWKKIDVNI